MNKKNTHKYCKPVKKPVEEIEEEKPHYISPWVAERLRNFFKPNRKL